MAPWPTLRRSENLLAVNKLLALPSGPKQRKVLGMAGKTRLG